MTFLNRMLIRFGLLVCITVAHLPEVEASSTQPVYYQNDGLHLSAGSVQFHFQKVDWLQWIQQTLLFNLMMPTLLSLPGHLSALGLRYNVPAMATAGHLFHHLIPEVLPFWLLYQISYVAQNMRDDAIYIGEALWFGQIRQQQRPSHLLPSSPLMTENTPLTESTPSGQLSIIKDENGTFHIQVPAYYYHPGNLMLAMQSVPLPNGIKHEVLQTLTPLAALYKNWELAKSFVRFASLKNGGEQLAKWLGWQHVKYSIPRIGSDVNSWLTPSGKRLYFYYEPESNTWSTDQGVTKQTGIISYADKGQSSGRYQSGQHSGAGRYGRGSGFHNHRSGGRGARYSGDRGYSGAGGGGRPPRPPVSLEKPLPADKPLWETTKVQSTAVPAPWSGASPQPQAPIDSTPLFVQIVQKPSPIQPSGTPIHHLSPPEPYTVVLPSYTPESTVIILRNLVQAVRAEKPMMILYGSHAQRAHMLRAYDNDGKIQPRDWDFKISFSALYPALKALGVPDEVPAIKPDFVQKKDDILWLHKYSDSHALLNSMLATYVSNNFKLGIKPSYDTRLILHFKAMKIQPGSYIQNVEATFLKHSANGEHFVRELSLDFSISGDLPEADMIRFDQLGELPVLPVKGILDHAYQMISTNHRSTGKMAPKINSWWQFESHYRQAKPANQHRALTPEESHLLQDLHTMLGNQKTAAPSPLTPSPLAPSLLVAVPPPQPLVAVPLKPAAKVAPLQTHKITTLEEAKPKSAKTTIKEPDQRPLMATSKTLPKAISSLSNDLVDELIYESVVAYNRQETNGKAVLIGGRAVWWKLHSLPDIDRHEGWTPSGGDWDFMVNTEEDVYSLLQMFQKQYRKSEYTFLFDLFQVVNLDNPRIIRLLLQLQKGERKQILRGIDLLINPSTATIAGNSYRDLLPVENLTSLRESLKTFEGVVKEKTQRTQAQVNPKELARWADRLQRVCYRISLLENPSVFDLEETERSPITLAVRPSSVKPVKPTRPEKAKVPVSAIKVEPGHTLQIILPDDDGSKQKTLSHVSKPDLSLKHTQETTKSAPEITEGHPRETLTEQNQVSHLNKRPEPSTKKASHRPSERKNKWTKTTQPLAEKAGATLFDDEAESTSQPNKSAHTQKTVVSDTDQAEVTRQPEAMEDPVSALPKKAFPKKEEGDEKPHATMENDEAQCSSQPCSSQPCSSQPCSSQPCSSQPCSSAPKEQDSQNQPTVATEDLTTPEMHVEPELTSAKSKKTRKKKKSKKAKVVDHVESTSPVTPITTPITATPVPTTLTGEELERQEALDREPIEAESLKTYHQFLLEHIKDPITLWEIIRPSVRKLVDKKRPVPEELERLLWHNARHHREALITLLELHQYGHVYRPEQLINLLRLHANQPASDVLPLSDKSIDPKIPLLDVRRRYLKTLVNELVNEAPKEPLHYSRPGDHSLNTFNLLKAALAEAGKPQTERIHGYIEDLEKILTETHIAPSSLRLLAEQIVDLTQQQQTKRAAVLFEELTQWLVNDATGVTNPLEQALVKLSYSLTEPHIESLLGALSQNPDTATAVGLLLRFSPGNKWRKYNCAICKGSLYRTYQMDCKGCETCQLTYGYACETCLKPDSTYGETPCPFKCQPGSDQLCTGTVNYFLDRAANREIAGLMTRKPEQQFTDFPAMVLADSLQAARSGRLNAAQVLIEAVFSFCKISQQNTSQDRLRLKQLIVNHLLQESNDLNTLKQLLAPSKTWSWVSEVINEFTVAVPLEKPDSHPAESTPQIISLEAIKLDKPTPEPATEIAAKDDTSLSPSATARDLKTLDFVPVTSYMDLQLKQDEQAMLGHVSITVPPPHSRTIREHHLPEQMFGQLMQAINAQKSIDGDRLVIKVPTETITSSLEALSSIPDIGWLIARSHEWKMDDPNLFLSLYDARYFHQAFPYLVELMANPASTFFQPFTLVKMAAESQSARYPAYRHYLIEGAYDWPDELRFSEEIRTITRLLKLNAKSRAAELEQLKQAMLTTDPEKIHSGLLAVIHSLSPFTPQEQDLLIERLLPETVNVKPGIRWIIYRFRGKDMSLDEIREAIANGMTVKLGLFYYGDIQPFHQLDLALNSPFFRVFINFLKAGMIRFAPSKEYGIPIYTDQGLKLILLNDALYQDFKQLDALFSKKRLKLGTVTMTALNEALSKRMEKMMIEGYQANIGLFSKVPKPINDSLNTAEDHCQRLLEAFRRTGEKRFKTQLINLQKVDAFKKSANQALLQIETEGK